MAKFSTKVIIDAIRRAEGNLTAAAEALGVSRSTIYRYVTDRATVKEALDETRESLIDTAENQLAKKIKSGDMTAIIFFLKTQGKSRGYVERQEMQHSGIVTWQEFIAEAREEIDDSDDPYT